MSSSSSSSSSSSTRFLRLVRGASRSCIFLVVVVGDDDIVVVVIGGNVVVVVEIEVVDRRGRGRPSVVVVLGLLFVEVVVGFDVGDVVVSHRRRFGLVVRRVPASALAAGA